MVGREAERVAQGVGELPAAGVPVARFLGQGRRQDPVDRLRKARPAGRQPRGDSDRWAYITAVGSSRRNGGAPVSNSKAELASAY